MDSHVATQCRRAKRSKAKELDLSCLGLPKWSPDIFGLVELEVLKLNDNSLVEVPSDISRLEKLVTLEISNNKLEKVPMLEFDKLQNLCSIRLEGNPVATSLSPLALQQLAQPGNSPQALRDLFIQLSKKSSASPAVAPPKAPSDIPVAPAPSIRKPSMPATTEAQEPQKKSYDDYLKELSGSEGEYSDDFHNDDEDGPKQLKPIAQVVAPKVKPVAAGGAGTAVEPFSVSPSVDKPGSKAPGEHGGRTAVAKDWVAGTPTQKDVLSSKDKAVVPKPRDSASGGRRNVGIQVNRDKKASDKKDTADTDAEVLRLRTQVRELQERKSKEPTDAQAEVLRLRVQVQELKEEVALSAPSTKANFASTLPSRLGAFDDADDVSKLKQQLQEEQRRAKRLERDNQKLQDRNRESSMSTGSSAAPHVELSEIQEGEILSSSGGFSLIYKGTWHGTPIAIKKLFDPTCSPENMAEFDNEVDKLGKLRHPNILTLLAVHRKPPAFSIMMEIVSGGSLFQLLHHQSSFNFAPRCAPPVAVNDLMQIDKSMALALSFMHERNIAHRDVKSHNVLVSPHLEAKLCDFGLARMKSELMTGAMQYAGTPQYMAPELMRQQKYTEKVDVWAFGVVLWETIAIDIPFANLDVPEIRELVVSGKMLPIPTSESAPRCVQTAVKSCWTVDYTARPTMADMLAQLSK